MTPTLRFACFAVALLASACLTSVNEVTIGTVDGGASGGGVTGGAGGGTGGGGGAMGGGFEPAQGEAACDQSQCLPSLMVMHHDGVGQLAVLPSGDELLLLGTTYSSTGLARLRLPTAALTRLAHEPSDPFDGTAPLRVTSTHAWFVGSYAGEIFGIGRRVRLSDGALEEVFQGQTTSGPVVGAFDVDETDFFFAHDGAIRQVAVSAVPATGSTVRVTLASSEFVADVRLSPTHVWWVSNLGLFRAPRAGGAPQLLQAGNFQKLKLSGDDAWVSGVGGLGRWSPGGFAAVLSGRSVEDFALARGTWFVAVRAETTVEVLDAQGAVQLEADDPGTLRLATLAVTAEHIALGLRSKLIVKSSAQPVSACGCAAPVLTFPAPAVACERALCGPTRLRVDGLSAGGFLGGDFVGVFRQPGTSDEKLKRVTLANSSSEQVFDLLSPQPVFAHDAQAAFVVASGGLWAVDFAASQTRQVLSNFSGPWRYDTPAAPMLVLDATWAYLVTSRGVGRVARSGGEYEPLLESTSRFIDGLRLDETHLYVLLNNTLVRLPKTGGTSEVLATGLRGEGGFDLSGEHVVVVTPRGVERVRRTGGLKSLVATFAELGTTHLTHLAVQQRDLVFVSHGAEYRLERFELGTRTRETLLRVPEFSSLRGVVIDAQGYALGGYDQAQLTERDCCP